MEAAAKTDLEFLYFTDPMCSWCYGVGPGIEALSEEYADRIPLKVVPGGLRPDETQPMPAKMAKEIAGHWHHVQEASGKDFDFGFFEKYPEFVYNTKPSCKAVAVANEMDAGKALELQHEIQKRFYADAQDPTTAETLTAAATSVGLDADEFARRFNEPAAEELVQESFQYSRAFGVHSYPTLVMRVREQYVLVTQGYRPLDQLKQITEHVLDKFYNTAAPRPTAGEMPN